MNPRPLHQVAGYRRLWLATAQIGLSSWMVQVGLFAALVSHYSASVMALVLLMATIPALLAGPWVGNWLDQQPRAGIAAWAGGGQAALLLVMAWLVPHHAVILAGVYAIYNTAGTLGTSARQQLLYRLMPPARRAEVNAHLGGVTGVTTIMGALLGGTTALWGLTTVFLLATAVRLLASGLLVSLEVQALRTVRFKTPPKSGITLPCTTGSEPLLSFPPP